VIKITAMLSKLLITETSLEEFSVDAGTSRRMMLRRRCQILAAAAGRAWLPIADSLTVNTR